MRLIPLWKKKKKRLYPSLIKFLSRKKLNKVLQVSNEITKKQKFYEEMFLQSEKIGFVSGYGLWDWPIKIYEKEDAYKNCDYSFYGKPAEITIKKYFSYLRI